MQSAGRSGIQLTHSHSLACLPCCAPSCILQGRGVPVSAAGARGQAGDHSAGGALRGAQQQEGRLLLKVRHPLSRGLPRVGRTAPQGWYRSRLDCALACAVLTRMPACPPQATVRSPLCATWPAVTRSRPSSWASPLCASWWRVPRGAWTSCPACWSRCTLCLRPRCVTTFAPSCWPTRTWPQRTRPSGGDTRPSCRPSLTRSAPSPWPGDSPSRSARTSSRSVGVFLLGVFLLCVCVSLRVLFLRFVVRSCTKPATLPQWIPAMLPP